MVEYIVTHYKIHGLPLYCPWRIIYRMGKNIPLKSVNLITMDLGKYLSLYCVTRMNVHLPADATVFHYTRQSHLRSKAMALNTHTHTLLFSFIEEGEVIPRCDAMCTFLISPHGDCIWWSWKLEKEREPRESAICSLTSPWPASHT